MLIHTDDCDVIGDSEDMNEQIYKKCDREWKCKKVDPEFILGVRRNIEEDKNGTFTCTMTMKPFIEGMVEAFREHLPKKTPNTPFPESVMLSVDKSVTDDELKEVLTWGYQRVVGMLLWCSRHCYPECLVGISSLCKLMSRPSKQAWICAMHMIAYLSTQSNRGITFSSEAELTPIAYSDASNKPDPKDGRAQYGYTILMAGGPVVSQSKKLSHVGLNAFHNEYMALCECSKATV